MDKGRTRAVIILVAGLLVLALALPASAPRSQDGVHPGSTYMSSRDGAKALYLILQRLGFEVERRTDPVGDLGPARLAFMLGPEEPLDEDESDVPELVRWVQEGGTLVYAESTADFLESPVNEAFGMRVVASAKLTTTERRVALVKEYAPATELSVVSNSRIVAAEGKDELTAVTVGDETVMQRAFGAGRVIAIATTRLASNERLGAADNALFFAILADRYGGGKPIVFDEHIHGMTGAAKLLPIARGPAYSAIGLLGLAMLLYAVGAGKRLGPPSPEPTPPRRSTMEQVTALARLYERTGSRQLALARLGVVAAGKVSSDAELVRLAQSQEVERKKPHGS